MKTHVEHKKNARKAGFADPWLFVEHLSRCRQQRLQHPEDRCVDLNPVLSSLIRSFKEQVKHLN